MKLLPSNLILGSLVLAIASTVYGQDKPVTNNTDSAAASIPGAASATSPTLRFEGTDLHIGTLPPVTFHGFLSQGFLYNSDYDYLGPTRSGSFQFTETALSASVNPFPHTRIAVQGFAFDVGRVGEYDPGLDYALVDYNFSEAFGVRAGRIRVPAGIYNSIQDVDLGRTCILLPQGIYDARYRDFNESADGGSVYGNTGLGKVGSLSYEAFGGMINLANNGGIARSIQDALNGPGVTFNGVNGCPEAGAQLWWATPIEGLRAGASLVNLFGLSYNYNIAARGFGNIVGSDDVLVQTYSLEYQWKSWTFQTEYRNLATSESSNNRFIPSTYGHSDAWYASAAYRANRWFEVGTYYTEDYANTANRNGQGTATPSDAYQKDLALSFRFDPKPWWILKLEGHYIHGTALLQDNADNPVRNNDGYFMLAAKTTFSF